MRYSATTNKDKNVNTFGQSILFFAIHFLNTYDPAEGEKWLHDFGGYIQNSDFPCTRININPFSKYPDMFSLTLYYKDTAIAWLKIEVCKHDNIMRVHKYSYLKKDFEMFHGIITSYFSKLNTETRNTMHRNGNGKTGTDGQTDRTKYHSGMYRKFQTTTCSVFMEVYG